MNTLASKLIDRLNFMKSNVEKLWNEIGIAEEERKEKLNTFSSSLLNFIKSFEEGEKNIQETQIKVVDEIALKLFHLTDDLKVPPIAETDEHFTLRELEKYLKRHLLILQEEELSRLSSLKSLRERESTLCKSLAEDPVTLPPDRIPTYESLSYLKKIVNSLEKELENREKSFNSFKASILAYMEELDMKPTSPIERDIMSDIEGLITLSLKNIKTLKMLSKDLQSKVEELREKEENLKNQISLLWDRLSIAEEKREKFMHDMSGCTAERVVMLESELKELQEAKRQNLSCFINRIRRELEELWENCYICEDDKENFESYFSEEYTDDILDAHEVEVQRLNDFYSNNEEILLNIKKWGKAFETLTQLDEKVNDPDRLFKNRGCALLQEEKERKRVYNELPRLERDIEQRIAQWEDTNLKQFFICGQSFKNFTQCKWQLYNEKKNNEKQLRQETRRKLIKKEVLLGSLPTPSTKRKILRSDVNQTSKYMRSNESQRTPSSAFSSTYGSTLSLSSKYSHAEQRKNETIIQRTKSLRQKVKPKYGSSTFNSSEVSSYDKFTKDLQLLSENEHVRSSVDPKKTPTTRSKGWPSFCTKSPSGVSLIPRFTSTRTPRLQPFSPSNKQMPAPTGSLSRRRSARLNPSLVGRTLHVSGVRSPKSPFGKSKLTTPIRNKFYLY